MWSQADNKDFWLRWLNRYKSLKCLWDEDEKRTTSKEAKREAYQELADLARQINPQADIDFVRCRISSLRSGYRREQRRKQAAIENGCDYEPHLFYYKVLDEFLNDTSERFDERESQACHGDQSRESPDILEEALNISKLPLQPGEKKEAIKKALDDCLSEEMMKRTKDYRRIRRRSLKIGAKPEKRKLPHVEKPKTPEIEYDVENTMDNFEISDLRCKSDEYEILGKRIAAHIRNMNKEQRLIAEKIITEICISGRMEKLTMSSVLCVESAAHQSYVEAQDEISCDDSSTI